MARRLTALLPFAFGWGPSAYPTKRLGSGPAGHGHFQSIAERLLLSDLLPKPEQLQSTRFSRPIIVWKVRCEAAYLT
jgi:hypothetical protein